MKGGVGYSIERGALSVTCTNRADANRTDAPKMGDVFTARAVVKDRKKDLTIDVIPDYVGYIKRSFNDIMVVAGHDYRFEIVGGPYQKTWYDNFYFASPLREIRTDESVALNLIDRENSLSIRKFAELMLGIGLDR